MYVCTYLAHCVCTYLAHCVCMYLAHCVCMYVSSSLCMYVSTYVSQFVCTNLSHCVCMYVCSLHCANSFNDLLCPCNLASLAEGRGQPERDTCHGWSECAGVHSVRAATSKVSSNCCTLCSHWVHLIFICYFVAIVYFHFDIGQFLLVAMTSCWDV